jgi:hypothetical protein
MKITHEEAAEMNARTCRAWYGPRAKALFARKSSSWSDRANAVVLRPGRRLHANFHERLSASANSIVDHE